MSPLETSPRGNEPGPYDDDEPARNQRTPRGGRDSSPVVPLPTASPGRTLSPVPEHFRPTVTGPRWRGKWRCAYCNHQGWPPVGPALASHWTTKHGGFCKHREAA